MPTLKRPSSPKIKTPRLTRKKTSVAKPLKKTIRTKIPTVTKTKHVKKDRKKNTVKLGTCYKNAGCRGTVLLKDVSKTRCKAAGGKSWKDNNRNGAGCQPI